MASGKENWIAVSKSRLCPKCHKPDNCKISLDGSACLCGRVPSNNRRNAWGQWLHYLGAKRSSHPTLGGEPVQSKKQAVNKPHDWGTNAASYAALGDNELPQLAAHLGVDVGSLRRLGVGVIYEYRQKKWTFPERDASGRVIGIIRRHSETGAQHAIRDSVRGLTFHLDWHKTPGPIHLVEGASDTAAGLTLGLCAIGRPNNLGGTDLLIELLKPYCDRQIIVLGENDQSKGRWPGREGAIATATKLANSLNRSVYWAFPPGGFKDLRVYLNESRPKLSWRLELNEVKPVSSESFVAITGKFISLEELRQELKEVRLRALEQPAIYFDGSQTGAGKSFADQAAIRKAGTSLILVPTHAVGDELATDLKKSGFHADKVPVRCDPDVYEKYLIKRESEPSLAEWHAGVCTNMAEVKKAEQFGLSAGVVVCPTCPHRDGCDYLEKHSRALAAPHLVSTHGLFAVASVQLTQNRAYIAIHENPNDMIRPLITANLKDLDWLLKVGAEGSWQRKWFSRRFVDLDLVMFFDAFCDKARELTKLLENSTVTQIFESTASGNKANQRRILQACNSLQERNQLSLEEVGPPGMKLILGQLSGKITHWAVRVTKASFKTGETTLSKEIVGVFTTYLPEDRTIVIADATNTKEGLEELIGRAVIDCTPIGRLERKTPVVQIPNDIKLSTRFRTVYKRLAGIMARNPQFRKIGVIGLPPHIKQLREVLGESPLGARILKTCYFGEGLDRASNAWHTQCDLLIVLGTPRVPQEAVIDELIRRGRHKEALEDGNWEILRWEAETPEGGRRIVDGSGYANLGWRQVHVGLVRAPMLQAIGRARSFQNDGIPVIVCSNEPLGLPVESESRQTPKLSNRAQQVWNWLELDIAKSLSNTLYTFGNITTGEAARYLGMSLSQASKGLGELAKAGYVTKLAHGKWSVTEVAIANITVVVPERKQSAS